MSEPEPVVARRDWTAGGSRLSDSLRTWAVSGGDEVVEAPATVVVVVAVATVVTGTVAVVA